MRMHLSVLLLCCVSCLQATVSSQGLILAANSDTPSYGGHTRQSGTASSCVHEAVHVQWDCTPMTTALAGSSSSHSSGQLSASLQLVGPHQHANVSAAVSCALLLRHEGWGSISDDAISLGLSQAMLPGRFQVGSVLYALNTVYLNKLSYLPCWKMACKEPLHIVYVCCSTAS